VKAAWPPSARIENIALQRPARAGRLDRRNAGYVLATLDRAIDGALAGEFDAVVTAPVQKSVINDAGIAFPGHTEYLARRASAARVVMMLVGSTKEGPMRGPGDDPSTTGCSPGSTHRRPPAGRTAVLFGDLKSRFGLPAARVAVTGLNPHAGEGGHLGREEIDIIGPAVERMRKSGHAIDGPLASDTVFLPLWRIVTTPCWRCTTTRGFRCSSTRRSATA
jgi:4-hydroxythreonine-4-phosphate dehydrogenase